MSAQKGPRTPHRRPLSINGSRRNTAKASADGQEYPEIKQRGFYSDILPAEAAPNFEVQFYFK